MSTPSRTSNSPGTPRIGRRGLLLSGAAGLGAFAAAGALGERTAAAATLTASTSPAPGATQASAGTEISFRGVAGRQLATLTVAGSISGSHTFSLLGHSDGRGVSAVIATPFTEGETVMVTHGLALAGTSGGRHTFRISTSVVYRSKALPGAAKPPAHWSFASEPSLMPPRLSVDLLKAGTAAGYIAMAPYGGGQPGPQLTTTGGEIVWSHPTGSQIATNATIQSYRGKPVLTWWEGTAVLPGLGSGEYVVLDAAYRQVARFGAGNGYAGDLHEMRLTPSGSALITIYKAVIVDLSSLGGPKNGGVFDGIVQEVDVATGRVMWEWHALDHIDISETYADIPKDSTDLLDYVHPNCASLDGPDSVIISLRSCHSAVRVSRSTGAIEWRLGGKRSTYRMGSNTTFHSQHNLVRTSDGKISMFDNGLGVGPNPHTTSRGLILTLDDAKKTATLDTELLPPVPRLAFSQGNMQELADGHHLVGWGASGAFTEYDAKGNVLYDAELAPGLNTYRAFRQSWKGSPYYAPKAAVNRTAAGTAVHMSWNGSTETASWAVLTGPSVTHLKVATTVQRTGFETSATIRATSGVVVVRALDSTGRTLATSRSVTI